MNLPGVYQTKKNNGEVSFRSSLTHKGRHISLGSFTSEEEAHAAYVQGCSLLTSEHKPSPDDYPEDSALSFEKWISLLNLKVNGLYFKTPIYLMKQYFLYYLSRDIILKFDLEDLFYYSGHKIMRRKGHLFVADYGMQVNLANRYGIRNHAAPGIDYSFHNGDPFDFRYENIEIHNTYHGVRFYNRRKKKKYMARVHVNGYLKVGYYDTAPEAAIAYNKAIEYLKEHGWNKNYPLNEFYDMKESVFLELSDSITLSPGFYKYVNET